MKEFFNGFEKIHIANIASLIIDEAPYYNLPVGSYNERLNKAENDFKRLVTELVPSDSVREEIFEALFINDSVLREVFFEAGILCGVKLVRAQNTDTDAYRELMRRCSEETEPNNP